MPKRSFRLILLLTAVAVGLVVVPASAETFLGDNSVQDQKLPDSDKVAPKEIVPDDVVTKDLTSTLPQQQEVLGYWNEKRIKAAKPTPLPLAAPQGPKATGGILEKATSKDTDGVLGSALPDQGGLPQLPGTVQGPANTETRDVGQVGKKPVKNPVVTDQVPASPTRTTTRSASAKQWTSGGAVVKTAGKVLYTMNGQDFRGSATVIQSRNKDTLITAGHVIYDGEYAENVTFVPGYDNGNKPYGTWTARALRAPKAWIQRSNSNDHSHDVGFIVLNKRDGKHISDVVGAQKIAFNAGKDRPIYAFGYPQYSPYNGETMHFCSDTASADRRTSSTTVQGIRCDMTEGASGGCWITEMRSSGVGTVVSVNAFSYKDDLDTMMGPMLGSAAKAAYDQAQRL